MSNPEPELSEDGLILRPRRPQSHRFGVRRLAGLSQGDFAQLTNGLRSLAEKHLHPDLLWRLQPLTRRVTILTEAQKIFPLLKRYDSGWPAEMHLQLLMMRPSWIFRRENPEKQNDSQVDLPIVRERPEVVDVPGRNHGHTTKSVNTSATASTSHLTPHTISSQSSGSKSPAVVTISAKANVMERRTILNLTREKESSPRLGASISRLRRHPHRSNAIADFLSGLRPKMTDLISTFEHAGVVDEESFQAVIDLPDTEQDSFVDDLRLKILHTRIIKRELKQLKRELTV